MQLIKATPHGDKLKSLASNPKLPESDKERVTVAVTKYNEWIKCLNKVPTKEDTLLSELIKQLNEYKKYIELDFIFDSESDFLYRQKGQLKLDNTILEEFLPYLFNDRLVPGLVRIKNLSCGPQESFAGLSFASPFIPLKSGGVFLKLKDQDFAISKSHNISITDGVAPEDTFSTSFVVSHFASEIKANLDKTMFQEASQTAAELKRAVPGARYILLCEFLDMTPITTKLTSIDEVIVLRKAKRIPSNIRAKFSSANDRKKMRSYYADFLSKNILQIDCFQRFVWHLNDYFPGKEEDAEDIVLDRGYF